MEPEYLVIPEVKDRLLRMNEYICSELEQAKEDIVQAREYGDLSENFSFDNAIAKQTRLKRIKELNEKYISNMREISLDDLRNSEYKLLYKVFCIEAIDWGSPDKVTTEKKVLLTPSIDLDLGSTIEQVWISSSIGQKLLVGERKFWITIQNTDIKVAVKRATEFSFSKVTSDVY